jgi:diguanylate cyclase (GGDEF)-like protein/PAS domain S-box-containing protein
MKRPPLIVAIPLIILLVLSAAVGTVNFLTAENHLGQRFELEAQRFQNMLSLVQYNTENSILYGQEGRLIDNVSIFSSYDNVRSVILLDQDWNTVYSSDIALIGTKVATEVGRFAMQYNYASLEIVEDQNFIRAVYPIRNLAAQTSQIHSWLYAEYDLTSTIQDARYEVLDNIVLSLVIIFIFSLLVFFFLERHLRRPLQQLQTSVQRIMESSLEEPIPEMSWPEFKFFAKSIDRERKTLQKYNEELQIMAHTFETQEGIYITDKDHNIIKCNTAFEQISGYRAEDVLGQNARMFRSNEHDEYFYQKVWQDVEHKGFWQGEVFTRRADGKRLPLSLSINRVLLDDSDRCFYITMFMDISEQYQNRQAMKLQATTDHLTGLPNRPRLIDILTKEIQKNGKAENLGALMFIDLDFFKQINDNLGHGIGDRYLKEIASRLEQIASNNNATVGRLGGDEFLIIVSDNMTEDEQVREKSVNIANEIYDSFANPVMIKNLQLMAGASIGITVFPDHNNTTASDTLRNADIAMYEAKKSGRGQVRFFTAHQVEKTQRRFDLQQAMNEAVALDQFQLKYQPIISQSGHIVAAECLIRWIHADKGWISPAEFIPMAESTGLIQQIGQWVLKEAISSLAKWEQHKLLSDDFKLAVNVSPREFDSPVFITNLVALTEEFQVRPERLILEITEHLLIMNIDTSTKRLNELVEHGFSVSLDDFGTGFSSLSHLQRFPISSLKIDRSFIHNLYKDGVTEKLVGAILSMARQLDIDVVAEGVENQQQLDFLSANQCDQYQGYMFSRPLFEEEWLELLAKNPFEQMIKRLR